MGFWGFGLTCKHHRIAHKTGENIVERVESFEAIDRTEALVKSESCRIDEYESVSIPSSGSLQGVFASSAVTHEDDLSTDCQLIQKCICVALPFNISMLLPIIT